MLNISMPYNTAVVYSGHKKRVTFLGLKRREHGFGLLLPNEERAKKLTDVFFV